MDLDNSAMIKLLKTYNSFGRTLNWVRMYSGLSTDSIMTVRSRLVTWVHIANIAIFICGHLSFCYHCRTSIGLLSVGVSWVLGFSSAFLKSTVLATNRKYLGELDVSLSGVFDRDLGDQEFQCISLQMLGWFYWPSIALACSIWIVFVMSGIRPFLVLLIQRIKGAKSYVYLLPFEAMFYPWDVDPHTWRYSVTVVYELYVACCGSILGALPDLLFGYYVFQMCAQLRALAYRCSKLTADGNYEVNLRQCIDHYERIARCRDYLERIWGPIILWMTISNAVSICLTVYRFLHSGKVVASLVYIIMKIAQTFIYGWFGTCLTIESENLREAIYLSDWPGSGEKRMMNDVFIMLMYKPLVLTAWGLGNLSVEMFVSVSNTAFSYYCMMRAMEE